MVTTIFVEDYLKTERYYIALSSNDFDKVEKNWWNEDALLVGLSDTSFFKGKTRWSELKPMHFKILILRNFIHLDRLKSSQKKDATHVVVQSLYFLICCFIKCVAENANTHIEYLKILRLNEDKINFDYHASLVVELDAFTPNEHKLKVVVDNS